MNGYSISENTFSQKGPSENAAIPSTKSSTFAALKGSPFSPATTTSGGNDERNPPSLENMGVKRFNTLRAVSAAMTFVISVSKGFAAIDDHGVLYVLRNKSREGLRGIFLSDFP